MVAYSFRPEFEPRIEDGSKLHTLRGDRRRHGRPGEELQLYVGMRTRACHLVDRKECTQFLGVILRFSGRPRFRLFPVAQLLHGEWDRVGPIADIADPDAFARADGFAGGLDAMGRFWRDTHGRRNWNGFLVGWGPPYLVVEPGLKLEEPDPLPPWSADPLSARPAEVARAIRRGGWGGAGLRRYRSLADGRVFSYSVPVPPARPEAAARRSSSRHRRKVDELVVLYDFTPSSGAAAVGPYGELEDLAAALIRYDRQRVDAAAWVAP